jgi:hypothetical protein
MSCLDLLKPGLPTRVEGYGGDFSPPKMGKMFNFLSKFEILCVNFLQSCVKFWQKLGLSALFAVFLAESQIKILPANEISQKVYNFSILCSISVGKSNEGTSAKIFRFSTEFLASSTLKTIGNPG